MAGKVILYWNCPGIRKGTSLALLILTSWTLAMPAAAAPRVSHDKSWWQAIIADDFAVPPGESLETLVEELSAHLGSPDPELRDDIAYNVLTHWIYVQRIVPLELRRELTGRWRANLADGIGEQGTDAVFLRSFSVLMLSVAAALDNEEPWLERAEFDQLLRAALTYLREERDTRGFDAQKGWIHSVAHTADLLKFLGRSRYLAPEDQSAILEAIADKLTRLDHVLAFGEDERLARAVVSIAAREDADHEAFRAFLHRLAPSAAEGFPTTAGLAVNQNRKHLAISLYALFATDGRDLESLRAAGEQVRVLLQSMMQP